MIYLLQSQMTPSGKLLRLWTICSSLAPPDVFLVPGLSGAGVVLSYRVSRRGDPRGARLQLIAINVGGHLSVWRRFMSQRRCSPVVIWRANCCSCSSSRISRKSAGVAEPRQCRCCCLRRSCALCVNLFHHMVIRRELAQLTPLRNRRRSKHAC